jgi:hypothetical protein
MKSRGFETLREEWLRGNLRKPDRESIPDPLM